MPEAELGPQINVPLIQTSEKIKPDDVHITINSQTSTVAERPADVNRKSFQFRALVGSFLRMKLIICS
jgi:hypothetical protein